MSHLHRFYQPELSPQTGNEIFLPEDEAHHALFVARLRDGEQVAVFDGRGNEAVGPIFKQGKRQARVVQETRRTEDPPATEVILAPAWLHKDKTIEDIVRRGTELGVSRFAFWRAHRSQRPPSTREKWTRLAVESCKQCGRLHLPGFDFFDSLETALLSFRGCTLVADAGAPPSELLLPPSARESCALIIGPEGDFTEEEGAFLRARGALPVSLGRHVLRTEVAAFVLAAVALNALGALGARLALPPESAG